MVEVNWTPQSLEDIENIAEFISKDSLKYAYIQVTDFFEAAIILETFPRSGRIVPETANKNIRELIVGIYRLIYIIKDINYIDMLAVHHSSRLLRPHAIKKKIRS